jgi:hypothetical protein
MLAGWSRFYCGFIFHRLSRPPADAPIPATGGAVRSGLLSASLASIGDAGTSSVCSLAFVGCWAGSGLSGAFACLLGFFFAATGRPSFAHSTRLYANVASYSTLSRIEQRVG